MKNADSQTTGWQPITSAPKDRPILGYRCAADSTLPEFYAVIWWGEALGKENCWLIYDGNHRGYGYGPFFVFNGPTHWMPLPSPPEDGMNDERQPQPTHRGREWLVIESSRKHAVFASDEDRDQKGYIPRDVAEPLLGRSLAGTVWFTSEESDLMRAHPDWRDVEP